jgi:hypothetical protein
MRSLPTRPPPALRDSTATLLFEPAVITNTSAAATTLFLWP